LHAVGAEFHVAAVWVVSPTTQLKADELAARPWLSVRVSVTDEVPTTVGVPVMAPVEELIASPVGSPVADHVAVVEFVVSNEPVGVRVEVAVLIVVVWADGVVTEIESTFQ